jgi:hypothetical protein
MSLDFLDYTPLRWLLFSIGLIGVGFLFWAAILRMRAELEMSYRQNGYFRRNGYFFKGYIQNMRFMILEMCSLTFASPLQMLSDQGRVFYSRFRRRLAQGLAISIPTSVADYVLYGVK